MERIRGLHIKCGEAYSDFIRVKNNSEKEEIDKAFRIYESRVSEIKNFYIGLGADEKAFNDFFDRLILKKTESL